MDILETTWHIITLTFWGFVLVSALFAFAFVVIDVFLERLKLRKRAQYGAEQREDGSGNDAVSPCRPRGAQPDRFHLRSNARASLATACRASGIRHTGLPGVAASRRVGLRSARRPRRPANGQCTRC